MKTGYIEYDTVTEFETEIDTGDIFVVGSDCGIYNIIFKKQLLNKDNKICGDVYIHAPNCTFEYPDKSAEYYFTEGDNSCDCNVSSIIRWEYGEDAIPELDCGDEIKLVAYKIEHWDSYYQRFDGDDLMWRVSLNEMAKS